MATEFVELVKKLHQSPDDPSLKREVEKLLPKMLYLAHNNDKNNDPNKVKIKAMALYQLAHMFAPNSDQYLNTMRQSATFGCTNAMLVVCQLLGKSTNPNDMNTAVHYLMMINKSNDSFIKEQAQKLLNEYPQLAKIASQKQATLNLGYTQAQKFFTSQQEQSIEDIEKIEETATNSI